MGEQEFGGFLSLFFTKTFGKDGDFLELASINNIDRLGSVRTQTRSSTRTKPWLNDAKIEPDEDTGETAIVQAAPTDDFNASIAPIVLEPKDAIRLSNEAVSTAEMLIEIWNTDTIYKPSSVTDGTQSFMDAIRISGHTDRRLIGAYIDACIARVFTGFFDNIATEIALLPGLLYQDMVHTKSFAETAEMIGKRFLSSLVCALPSTERSRLKKLYKFNAQKEEESGTLQKKTVYKDFYFERDLTNDSSDILVCFTGIGTVRIVPTYTETIYGELKCAAYDNSQAFRQTATTALTQAGEFTSPNSATVAMLFMKHSATNSNPDTKQQYGKIGVFVKPSAQNNTTFIETVSGPQKLGKSKIRPLIESLTVVGKECNVYTRKGKLFFYVPKFETMLPLDLQRKKNGMTVVFWKQLLHICRVTAEQRLEIVIPAPILAPNEIGGMFYLENMQNKHTRKEKDDMCGKPFLVLVLDKKENKLLRSYRLENDSWVEESNEYRQWQKLYNLFERILRTKSLEQYFDNTTNYVVNQNATMLTEIIALTKKPTEQQWQQMWPLHLEQTDSDVCATKKFSNPKLEKRSFTTIKIEKNLGQKLDLDNGYTIEQDHAYWVAEPKDSDEEFETVKSTDLQFGSSVTVNNDSKTATLNLNGTSYEVSGVCDQTILAQRAA